jgi:hypothetical protein
MWSTGDVPGPPGVDGDVDSPVRSRLILGPRPQLPAAEVRSRHPWSQPPHPVLHPTPGVEAPGWPLSQPGPLGRHHPPGSPGSPGYHVTVTERRVTSQMAPYFLCSGGLWSKVVHYIGDRMQFGTYPWRRTDRLTEMGSPSFLSIFVQTKKILYIFSCNTLHCSTLHKHVSHFVF